MNKDSNYSKCCTAEKAKGNRGKKEKRDLIIQRDGRRGGGREGEENLSQGFKQAQIKFKSHWLKWL